MIRLASRLLGFAAAAAAFPCLAHAATIYGLAGSGLFLVKMDGATPATFSAVPITGLLATEHLAGIDFRPRTGQLYGIGIVPGATDTVRTYTIDPTTGVATQIPGSSSFTVTHGVHFGVGFNPTVDRIRVVNDGDENFRVNPNNGARSDSPTNDTDINSAGNAIVAVAYDRSADSGFAVANRTTLFAISRTLNALVTIGGINQSPSPNGGLLLNAKALGVSLMAGVDAGFDIDVDQGVAYASLTDVAGNNRLYHVNLATGAATNVGTIGSGGFAIGALAVAPGTVAACGAEKGAAPRVRVIDPTTGVELFDFEAYAASMKDGVRVAVGDVDLDRVPDVITAPGKGTAAQIKVFSGATGAQLAAPIGDFVAFAPGIKGGVFVAAGDVNGDGNKDVIAGSGAGIVGELAVFSGADGTQILDVDPFGAAFDDGVTVASADFDLDGDAEIVVAKAKGAPQVLVLDAGGNPFTSATLPSFVNDFMAYPSTFKNGVYVAAGDVNGDGTPDIVTGGAKKSSEVAVFSGKDGAELLRFDAFSKKLSGGVRVAIGDVDGDGRYEILATPGSGKNPDIRAFDGITGEPKLEQPAFDGSFKKGAFVAGVRR